MERESRVTAEAEAARKATAEAEVARKTAADAEAATAARARELAEREAQLVERESRVTADAEVARMRARQSPGGAAPGERGEIFGVRYLCCR